MKKEDIVIGMKVVPHAKTVEGWGTDLDKCASWLRAKESNQNFMYVVDRSDHAWQLSDTNNKVYGGFFHARDFEPYAEEPNRLEVLDSDCWQSLDEAKKIMKFVLDLYSTITTAEFANGEDKEARIKMSEFLYRK
jgi:hypothetical protein